MMTETTTQLSTLVGFKLWSCGSTPVHLHTWFAFVPSDWLRPATTRRPELVHIMHHLVKTSWSWPQESACTSCADVIYCPLGHHAGVRHHQREVLRQHQELDSQYRGGRPRPFDVTWLLWFSELTLFRVGFEEVFKEMLVWRHHRIMWSVI